MNMKSNQVQRAIRLCGISLVLCAAAGAAFAQAPSLLKGGPEETPKQPETLVIKPKSEEPASPRKPADDQRILAKELRGVVIVGALDKVARRGVTNVTGVQVQDVELLSGPDFTKVVEPFLGQPMSWNRCRDLQDAIILYCRKQGHFLVDVILPQQTVVEDTIQLVFLEGKLGKMQVVNMKQPLTAKSGKLTGYAPYTNGWFSEKLILGQIRLRPGEAVNSKELNEDLRWLNSNPFRQVDVLFKQGESIGQSDIMVEVQDRIPVRPFLGYENSGTKFTGQDRLLAGFNWGNAFGWDHQLSYQVSTDVEFELSKGHSASYVIPLPWRHTLGIFGSYTAFKTDLNGIISDGFSYGTGLRYTIPLAPVGKYQHQVAAGFDFKASDNTLNFGSTNSFAGTPFQIANFVVTYNGLLPDKFGQTSIGLEAYIAPGGIGAENTDQNIETVRAAGKASYGNFRGYIERLNKLPKNFSFLGRLSGQFATTRLPPSEQMFIGGFGTVRGYGERSFAGDSGWVVNAELRSPPLNMGSLLGGNTGSDYAQLLVFFDAGQVHVKNPQPADSAFPLDPMLYSTGGGFRYSVRKNLALRFDYGWQLTRREERISGPHLSVLLSF